MRSVLGASNGLVDECVYLGFDNFEGWIGNVEDWSELKSCAPRLRSMNVADSEARPVFGPAGNKAGTLSARKPASKPLRKVEKSPVEITVAEEKKALSSSTNSLSPKTHSISVPSVLRRHEQLLHSNLSLNASCSSDASTDSFHSRASTGRLIRSNSLGSRMKPYISRPRSVVSDGGLDSPPDGSHQKKRCAWVTPNTDPNYAAFHDEEWGVPVHDDKKLFELLVLSGALSELTWPAILSKRHIFREVFADFDPVAVSKLNEKKLIAPGSVASSLLSELKLRAIIENACQISKVIDEFGSFDEYIWSFVNHKPLVSRFRYPRRVPVKTPKADVISKDLECIKAAEGKEENGMKDMPEEKKTDNTPASGTAGDQICHWICRHQIQDHSDIRWELVEGGIDQVLTLRVRADSIAFSPPRSRASPVNSPSVPTDHWVDVAWFCTPSVFLSCKLFIEAGAAAGALGRPCRFFGFTVVSGTDSLEDVDGSESLDTGVFTMGTTDNVLRLGDFCWFASGMDAPLTF
ncbi:hypothetical protein CRYUN_Cryun33cG0097100 [Craigia yunnanensis]